MKYALNKIDRVSKLSNICCCCFLLLSSHVVRHEFSISILSSKGFNLIYSHVYIQIYIFSIFFIDVIFSSTDCAFSFRQGFHQTLLIFDDLNKLVGIIEGLW